MKNISLVRNKLAKLFVMGAPKYLRIYDNGGATLDRYTVVFTGHYSGRAPGICDYISASETGAGVYLHEQSHSGAIDRPKYSHLGAPVEFYKLAASLRDMILTDYLYTWGVGSVNKADYKPLYSAAGNIQGFELISGEDIKTRFMLHVNVNARKGENSTMCKVYKYSVGTGIYYSIETENVVIKKLDFCYKLKERVIVDYGHTRGKKAGQSWGEVHDIKGYIGASTGVVKIPLLVYNRRSYGGGGLLSGCIVKLSVSKGGAVLYQHPKYKPFKEM